MLSDSDRAVLDFEGRFWKYAGTKEAAIAAEFGISVVRYYQRLVRLLDDPEALAYAPALIYRLRRRTSGRGRSTRTVIPL